MTAERSTNLKSFARVRVVNLESNSSSTSANFFTDRARIDIARIKFPVILFSFSRRRLLRTSEINLAGKI